MSTSSPMGPAGSSSVATARAAAVSAVAAAAAASPPPAPVAASSAASASASAAASSHHPPAPQSLSRASSTAGLRLRPLASHSQMRSSSSALQSALHSALHSYRDNGSVAGDFPQDLWPEEGELGGAVAPLCSNCGAAIHGDGPLSPTSTVGGGGAGGGAAVAGSTCSAHLPASLDQYVALHSQQSARGMEVVYGLQVELSKLIEELGDRYPAPPAPPHPTPPGTSQAPSGDTPSLRTHATLIGATIPRLPYRVVGHGGLQYWQDVRDGKIKPPQPTTAAPASSDTAAASSAAASQPGTAPMSPAASAAHAALIEAGILPLPADPFNTTLPSIAAPPPPVSPGNVLPSFVLLNLLRVGVRSSLTSLEEENSSLKEKLAMSELLAESLQKRINRQEARAMAAVAAGASETVTPVSPYFSFAETSSPAMVRGRPRSRGRGVQFSDDASALTSPLISPRNPSAPPTMDRSINNAASSTNSNSVSSRIAKQSAASTAALVLAVQNAALDSARQRSSAPGSPNMLSPRGGGGNEFVSPRSGGRPAPLIASPSGGGGGASGAWSKEDQLKKALLGAEASLLRWKARARAATDAAQIAALSHQQELRLMAHKLAQSESALHAKDALLSQRGVLLQLESIARRERDERAQAQQRFFAERMSEWEKEIRALFHPRKERLFVRKQPAALPAGASDALAPPTQGTTKPAAAFAAAKGAKRLMPGSSTGNTTPAMQAGDAQQQQQQQMKLLVSPVAESKEEQSVVPFHATAATDNNNNIDATADATLYPSSSSPLSQLERNMKTPAGKQWLGKLLNPPPPASSAQDSSRTHERRGSVSGGGAGGGAVQGHLVPGADVLAMDLLLCLDALFRSEYASLASASVELTRSLRTAHQEKTRHESVRVGDGTFEKIDMMTPPPAAVSFQEGEEARAASEVAPDGGPSPSALAALISSIPPASLAYLQALQRLFLALYSRLPGSLQTRFGKLQAKATAAARSVAQQAASSGGGGVASTAYSPAGDQAILNARVRDTMAAAVASANGLAASMATTPTNASLAQSASLLPDDAQTSSPSPSAPTTVPASSNDVPPSAYAQNQVKYVMDAINYIDPTAPPPPPPTITPVLPHSGLAFTHAPKGSSTAGAAAAEQARVARAAGALESFSPTTSAAAGNTADAAVGVPAHLARLELILHKVQSLAHFRGVILNI